MEQRLTPDPSLVEHAKTAITESPGWVRVGVAFGNPAMREEALAILAGNVVDRLINRPTDVDQNQLALRFGP